MAVAATQAAGAKHNIQAARRAYYDKAAKFHMAPLWEVLKNLVTPEPKTQCQPVVWNFGDVKKLMLEAGEVISAEEAERRVLVLENPGMPGQSRVTNSLFAGIQLILPGEIADVHQHVASAIRFVLEGEGAYTAVEGEKAQMKHGDFIITANWAPHDHGNPGKEPVMWLDVLDLPTINHFETSFAAHFDEKMQKTNHADGDSFERYASGVLPDGAPAHLNRSPVINYPYAKMRPILRAAEDRPATSTSATARACATPIRSMAGRCCRPWAPISRCCRKGFKGEPYRSTDGTIFAVAEGKGTTIIDGKPFDWGVNDVFVVPPWKRYQHNAASETPCCSRSPTGRRRKRSASGARGIERSGYGLRRAACARSRSCLRARFCT